MIFRLASAGQYFMLGTLICDDALRYLKLLTSSSFSPLILMFMLIPFALLVISLVFSALICRRLQRSYLGDPPGRLVPPGPARPSIQCHEQYEEALFANYFFESYYILHNYSIQLVRFLVFVAFGPRNLL